MKLEKKKRILILIDTATGWGRSIIRGIAKYAREQGNWELSIQPRGQVDDMRLPPKWTGDGIIARIATTQTHKQLKATGLPVVNVSSLKLKNCNYPRVVSNFQEVGQLATEYLLNSGFKNFAFCASGSSYKTTTEIRTSFISAVEERGCRHSQLIVPDNEFLTNADQENIIRWIDEQPKPLAVFAMSVKAPYAVISACRAAGILIPDEVAILSTASADELVLQVIDPAVSCVVTADNTIGYEAAKQLHASMTGKPVQHSTRISPLHVEERASSDIMQIEDESIKNALRYIRNNARHGIQVEDVAQHAGLSRRSLEIKMKQAIHRTPAEEIRQIRLDFASKLLTSSHLSIPDVAERSGFGTVEHFIVFFKKATGITPLQYSKKYTKIAGSVTDYAKSQ